MPEEQERRINLEMRAVWEKDRKKGTELYERFGTCTKHGLRRKPQCQGCQIEEQSGISLTEEDFACLRDMIWPPILEYEDGQIPVNA